MHKSTSVSDRVVTPTCSQLRWAAGRTAAECRHPSSPPYQPCLPTPPATPTHYLTRRKREYAFLSSFSNRLTWHLLLRPHFDPVLLIEVSRSEDDAAAFHIHRLQEEMSFIENLKTWNCSLEKWTGLGWTLVWFMLKVPGRPHYSSMRRSRRWGEEHPETVNSHLAQFGFVKWRQVVFGHHDDSSLVAVLPQCFSTDQGGRAWNHKVHHQKFIFQSIEPWAGIGLTSCQYLHRSAGLCVWCQALCCTSPSSSSLTSETDRSKDKDKGLFKTAIMCQQMH